MWQRRICEDLWLIDWWLATATRNPSPSDRRRRDKGRPPYGLIYIIRNVMRETSFCSWMREWMHASCKRHILTRKGARPTKKHSSTRYSKLSWTQGCRSVDKRPKKNGCRSPALILRILSGLWTGEASALMSKRGMIKNDTPQRAEGKRTSYKHAPLL